MKKLTVAVLPCPYFMEVTTDNQMTTLSGFEGIFLDTVLQSLGFEYEIVIPEDNEWGSLGPDGQWSGLIGMVQRETADLAFTYLTETELRSNSVNFSSAYTSSSVTFDIEKPAKQLSSKGAYLQSFDVTIWICLIGALLLMAGVMYVTLSEKFSIGEYFLKLFGSMLEQPMKFHDASARSKYLQGLWWIFSVIMYSSYSCALLSFLMVPLQAKVIQTFTELSEGVKKGEYKCFTAKGSISLQYLIDSDDSHLHSLGKAIEKNNWIYNLKDLPIKDLVSVNSVDVQDRLLHELLYANQPNIVISQDYLAVFPIAFAVGARFCCLPELNRIISKLTYAGLYGKLLSDASLKLHLSSLKEEKADRNHPLTMENISGALILLAFGHSLSIVVLIGEVTNAKRIAHSLNVVSVDQKRHENVYAIDKVDTSVSRG